MIQRKFLLLLFLLLGSTSLYANSKWFDQSHEALLPPGVEDKLLHYKDFPVFWWNFVVLEFPKGEEIPFGQIKTSCAKALIATGDLVRKSPCNILNPSIQGLLGEWSEDYIRRHAKPEFFLIEKKIQETLAKASLPMDRVFLDMLRQDPFNSLEEFKKLFVEREGLVFENHQGIFSDPKTNRVLIPIQMSYVPMQSWSTQKFIKELSGICDGLNCKQLGFIGPHFSTSENESRVRQDVDTVSVVGWLVFVVFIAFFAYTKKWRLLLLFLPLSIAMTLGAFATYLIFGKIHGLTLAFGPSIVGLAMDYGLHGAFTKPEEKGIWRANLFGLLTTLSIFVVVFFSELPLLKQLAVFSISGLVFGFILFYLFKIISPNLFHETPFNWEVRDSYILKRVGVGFLILGLLSPLILKPDLSLQQLNFETQITKDLRTWLYSSGQAMSPLVEIHRGPIESISAKLKEQYDWGIAEKINSENAFKYLPDVATQNSNLASWRHTICEILPKNNLWKEFFAPYFDKINCASLQPKLLNSSGHVPAYLEDLSSNGSWMTAWFPKTQEQTLKIQTKFPKSQSFLEILSLFSKTLAHELVWMIPLAILASLVLLITYFPSLKACLLSFIPFITGLGCYTFCQFVFNLNVSFISIIGLIMMFGFSVDYGIFIVNLYYNKEEHNKYAVWTSVTLSSFTTILGFTPLIFASHPALRHLGQSLFIGSVGTYIGAVWCLPWLFKSKLVKV